MTRRKNIDTRTFRFDDVRDGVADADTGGIDSDAATDGDEPIVLIAVAIVIVIVIVVVVVIVIFIY